MLTLPPSGVPSAVSCSSRQSPVPQIGDLIEGAAWHLHRVDPISRSARFLFADDGRIRELAFLDGREEISAAPPVDIALTKLLRATRELRKTTGRYIFHMSFCGSTHLARLIDATGKTLVLKEPQILVDLADWRANIEDPAGEADCRRIFEAARLLLSRVRDSGVPTVVKPSNWANNLLPDLVQSSGPLRIVLMSIERRAFLQAVFRGGRERMIYTARAAAHLARESPHARQLLDAATNATGDPLGAIARVALAAHELQRRIFAAAKHALPDSTFEVRLTPSQKVSRAALRDIMRSLDISCDLSAQTSDAIDVAARSDAKMPQRNFDPGRDAEQRRTIEAHHGDLFDEALAWADATFGIERHSLDAR